jgi:hypothetical protein
LKKLFRQLGRFAVKAGMSCLGRIAIDSSKFAANASSDSVVESKDFEKTLAAFEAILALVEEMDAREEKQDLPAPTATGVPEMKMREVIRAIEQDKTDKIRVGERMVQRIEKGVETIKAAQAEGASHVSLTDPDARMMPIGSKKKEGMGHQLEVAVDAGNLMVAQTGNHASDGGRLLPLVELAQAADPVPITQVTADTGYYHGAQIIGLQEKGLEVIVPDKETARKLHGRPALEKASLVFIPVEGRNAYRCPEGKLLKVEGHVTKHGQHFTKYKAETDCRDCPRAKECLSQPTAKRRNLLIGEFRDQLKTYIERFRDPEVRKAYDGRGPAVETGVRRDSLRLQF